MTDTSLRVSKEVRDDLARLGSKQDSFNTILRRLLIKSTSEAADLTAKMREATTDEEREKLLDQKTAALSRKKTIADELENEKQAAVAQKQAQDKAATEARVKGINDDLQYLKESTFYCDQDGHVLRFSGPKNTAGLSFTGESWKTIEGIEWLAALDCDGKCQTRYLRSVSELRALEKSRKQNRRSNQ